VTFGAGGSTQSGTLKVVSDIHAAGAAVAPHLSCVGSSRESVKEMLSQYQNLGVKRIVALRGDLPSGMGQYGEFHHANELVEFIRAQTGDWFHIDVAAYPEYHPQTRHAADEVKYFKQKVDAGANAAITQYFYNADAYFRFLDEATAAGVNIPIVPGIVPVQNFKQTASFAARCGACVPAWLADRFEGLDEDVATRKLIAAAVAAEQVLDLVDRGVTDFHFYTMNRADLVYAICHLLGLRPHDRQAA